MAYDENDPVGMYLNRLNELAAALEIISSGLDTVAGALPVDDLRQLERQATTVHRESTDAGRRLEYGQETLDAGRMTLENTTLIIDPQHVDFQAVGTNMRNADSELKEAKLREASVAQTGELGAAALGDIGQEMAVQVDATNATLTECEEIGAIIDRIRGIVGPTM